MNKSNIVEIEKSINSIFDILRNEISSEDHHVILFFLSVYKDGFINTDALLNDANNYERFFKSRLRNSPQYLKIYQNYNDIVNRINSIAVKRILIELSQIDSVFLKENFTSVFDKVLYKIAQSQGRFGGDSIQPIELTRFICNLVDLPNKAKVFNPFAGLASFGVSMNNTSIYFGQEISPKTWAIGALRMMAYGHLDLSNYVCDDSITHWPYYSQKFDLIISNPPFGIRIDRQYRDIEPEFRTIEQFLIEKGIKSLSKDGKLVTILPQGFLFNNSIYSRQLRESLINLDLIDSIISLPNGILLNSNISLVVLVLNNKKINSGKVKFVDARKFIEFLTPRDKKLKDVELIRIIKENNSDSDIVKNIEVELIKNSDYNLSFYNYFKKEIKVEINENLVKLGDILEHIRGQREELSAFGKYVQIYDLKDDKLDFNLEISKIESIQIRRQDAYKISESCLLISTRTNSIKPTLFDYKGDFIYKGMDILSFKIDESKVDKAFLINELHSDYVKEQIDSFRIGINIQTIRKEHLFDVLLILPSLEEQKKKVSHIYEEKILGEKTKVDFIKKKFNEELGIKQHNIRQHLKNVKDSLDVLLDFMNKNNGSIKNSDLINVSRNITVETRFQRLYSSLESVISEVNNLTNEQYFDKPTMIDIVSIVSKTIEENINHEFEITFTKDEVIIQDLKIENIKVYFSEKDMKELINNVIENATRHGFINKRKDHKILFDLTIEDSSVVLKIINNGLPFPTGIVDSFGTKGIKASTTGNKGIGVWKIIQAIKHFGHKYEVINQPDNDFPAGWIFKFDLNND